MVRADNGRFQACISRHRVALVGRLRPLAKRLSAPLFRHFLGARIEKLPKEDRYASRDQAGVFLGGLHGL
jgi:hypothetical protein